MSKHSPISSELHTSVHCKTRARTF